MIAFACDRYRLLTRDFPDKTALDAFLAVKRETGNTAADKEAGRYWCPGCPPTTEPSPGRPDDRPHRR